jgi:uncharacterized protein (TIGR03083 family)
MPSLDDFAEFGVLEHDRAEIRDRVVGAWDEFLRIARGIDLETPSRLPGWRAFEICVHLGSWDDYQPVTGVLSAARAAKRGKVADRPPDLDTSAAMVIEAHRDASRTEVLDALLRNRDQVAAYLQGAKPRALDRVLVVSPVGPLPTLTIIHAQVYELAVHGLDLAACGAPAPGAPLLEAGLAALTDAAGAVAARVGIISTAGIRTEVGSWAFRTGSHGWEVGGWKRPGGAPPPFRGKLPVRVDAPAAALLDASAGRINPLKAVLTRRLKVHGLPGLMGLAPIVETVPGIPGGPALRLAAKGLAGAGGALGRLTRH